MALAFGVSVAVVTPARAKPGEPGAPAQDDDKRENTKHDRDKDRDRDHDKGDKGNDSDKDSKRRGPHAHSDDGGEADKDKDDDKRDTEAKEFRRGLFERREHEIVDVLNRDRKVLTDEVRDAIRQHWRHLARLLRIRELAFAAKENAFTARVQQDIDREEKAFNAQLEKLRGQAPDAGGAR